MKVLSMIDSLIAAGAERMAVNIANGLAEKGIESHLCATHAGGPLEEFVGPDVKLLVLNKRGTLDLKALMQLRRYVKVHSIEIIHAHSSSIFWALLIKVLVGGIKVVWHDHYGLSDKLESRPVFPLKVFALFMDYAFVVNDKLLNFAINVLQIPKSKVSFLVNFPDLTFSDDGDEMVDIPEPKQLPKLVCLANLRPQKDHHNLLDAFLIIKNQHSNAGLYLVGGHFSDEYYNGLVERINSDEHLKNHVHILGSRNDVAEILSSCDIGILSSQSEGLPVSLLEYGLAKLPVVCTNVGDCSFVLDSGRLGKLVQPGKPAELAEAVLLLLQNPVEMQAMGQAFQQHIVKEFSREGAIVRIINIYNSLIVNSKR
jgi:glycosyltransferase involved in cell wall biosynthesis